MATPTPDRREVLAIALAWMLILPVELWSYRAAFQPPEPWRVLLEALSLVILAASQIQFARGWVRSPLLPLILQVALTSGATGSDGLLQRFFAVIGAAVLVSALIYALLPLTRRAPILSACAGALLGGLAARFILLSSHGVGLREAPGELLAEMWLPRSSGSGSSGPPIVLITVDTLRWDHLVKTRTWARLSARGRWWERAMSTSSWTVPAMASIATGLPVDEHGADARIGGGVQGLRPEALTLASELGAAGYTSSAVFSNAWLTPELGFSAGFDRFSLASRARPHRLMLLGVRSEPAWVASSIVERAMAEADALPRRGAFLWVHFMDVHQPYQHLEGPLAERIGDGRLRGGLLVGPAEQQQIREAYQREVELLDVQLGRLLDHLEARFGAEEAVWVLTADHGEELWDHGEAEHGHSHHGEVVDVGLVIAAPHLAPGPGAGVASLVDIAPTIRAAVGLPPRGIDLREGSGVPADRIAEAWGNVFYRRDRSVRGYDQRLIAFGDSEGGVARVERYQLSTDPGEHAPSTPEPGDPLLQALLAVQGPAQREAAETDEEALKALGYLE